ncbi:MAG TPA: metallophosphoesterase family protein [Steroidobacteraceae bacterium]|jgi:predicted phosphodiesterase|nr:metallophosphoesterase family protein [Steroidobacteraceae bacterium]
MRLAILSDIHANLQALEAVLRDFATEGADRIVCLGDIVGYNANPIECLDRLRELDVVWVAGSHERAVTGQITTEGFSATATRAIAWTRARLGADMLAFLSALPAQATVGRDLIAVHGALHPPVGCETVRLDTDERRLLSFEALRRHPSGARICAFGHTHQLGIYELHDGLVRTLHRNEAELRDDAYYLINPGAVGESRTDDRRATYMILDTERRTVRVKYVPYDFASARAKTRRAGLLPRFWFLPPRVRAALKRSRRALHLGG